MPFSNIVIVVIGSNISEFWGGTLNTTTTKQSDVPYSPITPDAMAANDYTMAIGANAANANMIIGSASLLNWEDLTVDNGPARGNPYTTKITSLRWLNPCEANVGVPTGEIEIPTTTGDTITLPAGNPGQVLQPGTNPGDPPQWVDIDGGKWSDTPNLIDIYRDSKVAIGDFSTIDPEQDLHVKGNLLLNSFQQGSENGIFFREGFSLGDKYNLSIMAYGTTPHVLSINAYGGIDFNTGSNARQLRMVISTDGDVGIGIEIPETRLHVAGGRILLDNPEIYQLGFRYSNSYGQYWIGANAQLWPDLIFSNNVGSETARLTATGNFNLNSEAFLMFNSETAWSLKGKTTTTTSFLGSYAKHILYTGNGANEGLSVLTSTGTSNWEINNSGETYIRSKLGINQLAPIANLDIKGTANNSGPANLRLTGITDNQAFVHTEVFRIWVAASTEITRLTATGYNGWAGCFEITLTGHTAGIGNGGWRKLYSFDGTTATLISTVLLFPSASPVIAISITSNDVIISIASSDGVNALAGVMEVKWYVPHDFGANTAVIS